MKTIKFGKKIKKIKNQIKSSFNKIFYFLKIKKNPDFFFKKITGVIHVGANEGQERDKYKKYSLSVVWVEPIPEVFEQLKRNINDYPNQKAFKYLLTDQDDQEVELKISNNNGLSSSILNLGLHKKIWPEVNYINSMKLKSSTLNTLINKENLNIKEYQALILDTQGSELLILKGASEILVNMKYIVTEAADFDSYVGCCNINDLSEFLQKYGFKETSRKKFAHNEKAGSYYDVIYAKK